MTMHIVNPQAEC